MNDFIVFRYVCTCLHEYIHMNICIWLYVHVCEHYNHSLCSIVLPMVLVEGIQWILEWELAPIFRSLLPVRSLLCSFPFPSLSSFHSLLNSLPSFPSIPFPSLFPSLPYLPSLPSFPFILSFLSVLPLPPSFPSILFYFLTRQSNILRVVAHDPCERQNAPHIVYTLQGME